MARLGLPVKRQDIPGELGTIELEPEVAIEKARAGDETAVIVLFRSFNPPLIRYLRHQIPYEYEDIASETWLSIAKGIGEFEGGPADFRAWMFAIARNKMADHYRSKGKAQLALERQRRRFATRSSADDQTATPALSNVSAQDAIEALTAKLPKHHAEVLLLRIVADLSVEEVAKLIGKSPEAVRVIQHRALGTLVKTLNKKSVT